MSLLEGYFPACLKVASFVPVYKGGNKLDPGNYRPISILPMFSKVLERMMKEQLVSFMERNNLFSSRQYGFRRGRSTHGALLSYIQMVQNGFENLGYTSSIFYDLRKAFDCVSHKLLLNKLAKYGLDTQALVLLSSYLTNRRQCVRVGAEVSGFRENPNGVPQGSVLGPILFLIYINDLPLLRNDVIFHMFVDDTTVSVETRDLEGLVARTAIVGEEIVEWFTANRMAVNVEKTTTMILSLRDMSGVENPASVRFLGVTVDPKLGFGPHIDALATRINKNIFLLRNLSNMMAPGSMRQIYHGLIYPHMTYAILTWGHVPRAQSVVFRLQRKAVRVVCRLGYREDCREGFINSKILTFPSIYILFAVLHAHETLSDRTLGAEVHGHYTRGNALLRIDLHRINKSKNGTNYWCLVFYNCLPIEIRGWTLGKLRTCLKAYLYNKGFYSFDEYLGNDFGDFVVDSL